VTNLDYVIGNVYYDEAKEQLLEMLDGLYMLDREHPDPIDGETVAISVKTINDILTAYRKLVA
jgi:hypothetical protein